MKKIRVENNSNEPLILRPNEVVELEVEKQDRRLLASRRTKYIIQRIMRVF